MSLPLNLMGEIDTYSTKYSIQLPIAEAYTIRLKQKSSPGIYLRVLEYSSSENSISVPVGPICVERFFSVSQSECIVIPTKNNTPIQVHSNYENTIVTQGGSFVLEIEKGGETLPAEGTYLERVPIGAPPSVWHGSTNYKRSYYKRSYYKFTIEKDIAYKTTFHSEDNSSILWVEDDKGNGRGCFSSSPLPTATCTIEPRSQSGEQLLGVSLESGIDKSMYSIQIDTIE